MKKFKQKQNKRLGHIVREKNHQKEIKTLKLGNTNLIMAIKQLKEESREQKAFIDMVSETVDELFIGFKAKEYGSEKGYGEDDRIRIPKKKRFSQTHPFSSAEDGMVSLDQLYHVMHIIGFDACIDALNNKLHAYVKINGTNRVGYIVSMEALRSMSKGKLMYEISKNLAEFMKRPEFMKRLEVI